VVPRMGYFCIAKKTLLLLVKSADLRDK